MTDTVRTLTEAEFDELAFDDDQFRPGLYDVSQLGLMYVDGRMTASVAVSDDGCGRALRISTWDSRQPGNGHSRAALEWLRTRFDPIIVLGAGELDDDGVGDIATCYWLHMRASGLVDTIILDDGSELAAGTDDDVLVLSTPPNVR